MSSIYPFDVDPGPIVDYLVIPLCTLDETVGFFVQGTDDEAVARRVLDRQLDREYQPDEAAAFRRAIAQWPIVEAGRDWRWESTPDDEYETLLRDPDAPEPLAGVRFGFTVDVERD